jgi:hypothetical protein
MATPDPKTYLQAVYDFLDRNAPQMDRLEKARLALQRLAEPIEAAPPAPPEGRTFTLLAQGDSWFNYFIWPDIVHFLRRTYHHLLYNLAEPGRTMDEMVYGPVPAHLAAASGARVDCMAELVNALRKNQPVGLLLSGGGNDVAGPPFYSFVNDALSAKPGMNAAVLDGVVKQFVGDAYRWLIEVALGVAQREGFDLKVFTHGYDYPWPDGRAINVPVVEIALSGPWFSPSLSKKNYPYAASSPDGPAQLDARRAVTNALIDSFADMHEGLAAAYPGQVVHVDLRGTLPDLTDWANELHPTEAGFQRLAATFNDALQANL